MKRTTAAALAALAGLALAGCAPAPVPMEQAPPDTRQEQGQSPATASPAPEAPPTTTPDPQEPAEIGSERDECLVGTWAPDPEAIEEAALADNGQVAVSGRATYEFEADGAMSSTFEDWTWLIENGEGTMVVSGTAQGRWSTSGGVLSMADESDATVVEMHVRDEHYASVAGRALPTEGIGYACEGDSLELERDPQLPADGPSWATALVRVD